MTMPMEYVQASKDFEAFMEDFMALADLPTHHRAYHSIRAVLHVFRSHLTTTDSLKFANILPPILRAIFVEDWRPSDDPHPFPARADLFHEIKAIRRDHNLAPETVISDAAKALRMHIDNRELDRVLLDLPIEARSFWAVE